MCFATALVDRGTDDHHVVDDGETTFAINPVAGFAHDIAVGQHGRLVHGDALAVKLLCLGELILGEELPRRTIDDFIWSVAKDVDHRV